MTNKELDTVYIPKSDFPRVVIIGGGFAGLSLIKGLKDKKVQVVLVDRNNFHQFQPLFYQTATCALEPDSIVFPLRKQIRNYKNVCFRFLEVSKIDTSNNTINTDRGTISYDFLVVATGTQTNFFGMEHVEKHALGMKSIGDSLSIRHRMLVNLERATMIKDHEEKLPFMNFVVVGGGPAGVEMSGSLGEFANYIVPKDYAEYPRPAMNIYLIEASDRLLIAMSDKASAKTLQYLERLGVHVIFNGHVVDYDGTEVRMSDGKKILSKTLIWTAGVKGRLPKGIHEKCIISGNNRLRVDGHLKVEGCDHVYAMGDIAAQITEKLPKGHPQVAQVAMQQGKYLSEVLCNTIKGKNIVPFQYRYKGSLATVGKRRAVADIGKFKFSGYLAWLLWSVVHLFSISGFRNKTLVALNWMVSYFAYEKSNRLIIRNGRSSS